MAIKEKFKILMVTSELAPFAKSGGLGDMVAALTQALIQQGHDVRVVLPRYYNIDKSKFTLLEGPLGVPLGFGQQWCGVYEGKMPHCDAPIYFLDHEGLYGRQGIYGPTPDSEWGDNLARYSFLSRGAFQLCKKLDWIPNIMHAHDWPSALVPVYLYTWEDATAFCHTASVFTVHNLGYQGWFPKQQLFETQLSQEDFVKKGLEVFDTINLMKAGLVMSDLITTVSPTYSQEVKTLEYGEGLDWLFRAREHDLFGILNGVDYSIWNPSKDTFIAPNNYDYDNLSPKWKIKADLQKQLGLEVNPDIPLFGIVTRLAEQKGLGALCGPTYGSLYNMCRDMKIQFAILGTGERWAENELQNLASQLPNLSVQIRFDNKMSHLIEAGSDFFLMPSKYEPCGLNQLYSLRYGTLPIVRRTGGLADTVEHFNQETGEGTGFVFNDLTPQAIYDIVGHATWAYYNRRKQIEAMRVRAMKQDFSWEKPSEQYTEIYQWALDRRLGRFPRTWV